LVYSVYVVCSVYSVRSVYFVYNRFPGDWASGGPVRVRRTDRCLPPPSVGLSFASAERACPRSKSWKIEAPRPCLRHAGCLPVRCTQTGGRQASRSEKRRHPMITCLTCLVLGLPLAVRAIRKGGLVRVEESERIIALSRSSSPPSCSSSIPRAASLSTEGRTAYSLGRHLPIRLGKGWHSILGDQTGGVCLGILQHAGRAVALLFHGPAYGTNRAGAQEHAQPRRM